MRSLAANVPWSRAASRGVRQDNAAWLASQTTYDRFRIAYVDHIQRNWGDGITQTMRLPLAALDDKTIGAPGNCSLDITACSRDSDCTLRCISRTDGKYICRKSNVPTLDSSARTNEEDGICMFEGITMPPCNYDHGGVLAASYDPSLREIIYTCLCTQSEIWTGAGCQDENPYYCHNGKIFRRDGTNFEWSCSCPNSKQNILLKINKESYQYESRDLYICVSKATYDNLQAIQPEKYTRISN